MSCSSRFFGIELIDAHSLALQNFSRMTVLKFLFTTTFFIGINLNAAGPKTFSKRELAKQIHDLKNHISGSRMSDNMVKSFQNLPDADPRKIAMKNPKASGKIKIEIENSYIEHLGKNLSKVELEYLATLYKSSLYQKYMKIESDWNNSASKILNDATAAAQKRPPAK